MDPRRERELDEMQADIEHCSKPVCKADGCLEPARHDEAMGQFEYCPAHLCGCCSGGPAKVTCKDCEDGTCDECIGWTYEQNGEQFHVCAGCLPAAEE